MPWIQVGSGGLAWASPGSATGASSSRTMSRRFMLGARLLHELAHLFAELAQALLGLGGPRELLGREHGPDLERGLRAVLRELVAELADAPELGLQVGRLKRPGRQQLRAKLLLGLAELLDERAGGGPVRGQDAAHLRLLLGGEVAERIMSQSSPSVRPMGPRMPPSGPPGPTEGDWARAAVAVDARRSAAARIARVVSGLFMVLLR